MGDLGEGGGEFGGGIVVEAGLEGGEDGGWGVAFDGDDEGELEPGFVLGVEGVKGCVVCGGEPIESSSRLFFDGGVGHLEAAAEVGVGADE